MGNEELNKIEAVPGTGKIEAIDKTISASLSMIERADIIIKRIEEGNKRAEELLARQDALAARIALSGRAEAGFTQKPDAPMSEIEYSKKFMAGEINPFK